MSLWAVVPVKPLRIAKSRLSGVLSEDERAALSQNLVTRTLKTLASVPEINQILVISRDTTVLAFAHEMGLRTIQEDSNSDLNVALQRATIFAQFSGASQLMIVPADLPLMTTADIIYAASKANRPPVMVIAPDRRKDGTNLLLISPVGSMDYYFGPGSYQQHVVHAKESGMRVEILDRPTLALDLDLPDDLNLVRQMDEFALAINS